MRNKIITAGSGLFLAFGSVGGFEQGTMNLGQNSRAWHHWLHAHVRWNRRLERWTQKPTSKKK